MKITEEMIKKLSGVYIGKTKFSEMVWMMTMTNLMHQINFEKDLDANGGDDCVIEMKLRVPKKILVGYLKAMDKTTDDIKSILEGEKKELIEANEPSIIIQKFNGAFFIAGMAKLIHENAKSMINFIFENGVVKKEETP